MPWGWLCGLAPILNGEGMGVNDPYLWPSLASDRVALLRNMAPHPVYLLLLLLLLLFTKSSNKHPQK
jgi:hypothetical protein